MPFQKSQASLCAMAALSNLMIDSMDYRYQQSDLHRDVTIKFQETMSDAAPNIVKRFWAKHIHRVAEWIKTGYFEKVFDPALLLLNLVTMKQVGDVEKPLARFVLLGRCYELR